MTVNDATRNDPFEKTPRDLYNFLGVFLQQFTWKEPSVPSSRGIINGQECNFSLISWKTHDIGWLLHKCCHPIVCCYCNLSLRVGSSKAKLLSCLCLLACCSVLLRWSNAHPLANSDWHEIEVVFDWCRKFHMDVRRTFSITVFSRVGFKLLCLVQCTFPPLILNYVCEILQC